MKIEKEIIFKIELSKDQFLLIKAALARFIDNDEGISNSEDKLANELYELMSEVIRNA